MGWAIRHPILIWSLAWGLAGTGLIVSDVFSTPRHGPLWVAPVLGAAAWSVAGAATFRSRSAAASALVWGAAYLAGFMLAAVWGDWFERSTVGPISSAGFVGALLGWAAGASGGALASARTRTSSWPSLRAVFFAMAWGTSWLLAGLVGLVAAMVLAQISKTLAGSIVGERTALTAGWGVGCALGGLLAASLGLAARRGLVDDSTTSG